MLYELKIPSLGENSPTGTVNKVLKQVGEKVAKDEAVLDVAMDKVNVDVPSEVDGTVTEILVKVGDEVAEGKLVMRIETDAASGAAAPASQPAAAAPVAPTPVAAPATPAPAAAPAPAVSASSSTSFRTSPLARKRAKELGINLSEVKPADGSSRISYKDVMDLVKRKIDLSGGSAMPAAGAPARKPLPNFEKYGTVERQAQTRIGVVTAENMHYAFNTIPHAWISEKADITKLEQLRQQFKDSVKAAGGNLTTTAIVAKAVAGLLRKMPQFNASLDEEKHEVIFKKYVNVGIAVDTPRGLLVPVLRNTDYKGLTEIAIELTELSTRTREGKNKPDDMEGGTFTISNIGGIGGTNMISIVNWPQVAILSMVAAQREPVWNEATQSFEPRLMMPMTIGWDHRVINGADAARFLVELKKILEEPFLGWL